MVRLPLPPTDLPVSRKTGEEITARLEVRATPISNFLDRSVSPDVKEGKLGAEMIAECGLIMVVVLNLPFIVDRTATVGGLIPVTATASHRSTMPLPLMNTTPLLFVKAAQQDLNLGVIAALRMKGGADVRT